MSAVAKPRAAASNGVKIAVVRELDSEQIAAFTKRGHELMMAGDIAAARLLLQRAAEAGDPGAAFGAWLKLRSHRAGEAWNTR